MVSIIRSAGIGGFAKFIAVSVTRAAQTRMKHGCPRSQVYRTPDSHRVTFISGRESRERLDAFLADPAVRETKKSSGTTAPPEFTFAERVCEIPG